MSEWAPKRFWSAASVRPVTPGYGVALDDRPVRTPAKAELYVPNKALAARIAEEFDAQQDRIDPMTMPFTRTTNAAIDKVAVQRVAVADLLADYADSDLLCYRADAPDDLVARQTEVWDPLLDWAAEALGARLEPRVGVMHVAQDPAALVTLRDQVHDFDPFELAAFHDLVSLSGSLIIAFAAARQHLPAETLWQASRVDETWQAEQWGEDEDAAEAAAIKRDAFLHADHYMRLLAPKS